MPTFSDASEQHLATCDQRLQYLMRKAILRTPIDFTILCGYRDKAAQDAAMAAGTTQRPWPTSNHNRLPSLAVDIAPYPIDWNDEKRFEMLAHYILGVAHALDMQVVWGGNWVRPHDMPHFEVKEV